MIQEIINYTKHLKENSPHVFEQGLESNKGLHIFLELDDEGKAINFPGEKGVNWDYYDGKEMSSFLRNIVPYDLASTYVTMNKQKKFDPKQKIHSASPFAVAFNFNFNDTDKDKYGIKKKPDKNEKVKNDKLIKSKRIDVVLERIDDYFENTIKVFDIDNDQKNLILQFKTFLVDGLNKLIEENPRNFIEINKFWKKIKENEYFKIYLKNMSPEEYEKVYAPYLNKNIFNKEKYNITSDNETRGAIDYYTTFADNKMFLKHQTGVSIDGISYRFTGEEAQLLNLFGKIKQSKIFPNPVPLFVDKNEFSNTDDIISIFKEDKSLKYSQILKKIFKSNEERVLQNYYLLFFSGLTIEDFDFVSKFRYSLKENDSYPEIKNLFALKDKESIKSSRLIKNIFHFEADIVKTIFNNSLVKIKEDDFKVSYFGEIKPEYVSGGEPIYQMILKYRKAFYDYIYKSKTQAINSFMWDEIMWNSIIGDLRSDKITDKGYHSKEYSIKEKLNIWFSLCNYFVNDKKEDDMASKIPELLEKMKEVANNDNEHFKTTEEFAFGAGQVIREILNKSEAHERTHALLEPFLQKTKGNQLNLAIARAFETYKHGFKFYKGNTRYAFDKIMSETMGFEMNENLKKELPMILAGYFAKSVFEKDDENNDNKESKNE